MDEILTATADFHDGLGQAADPHIARRLRYLADEHLCVIRTDLSDTSNALADRHAPHPGPQHLQRRGPRHRKRALRRVRPPAPPRALPAPPPAVAAGLRR
ncbi:MULTISPECIES: hypothetical protein [unclassified Streptomyces]|uniref:hypothetical protein n=1 Tax=unclassified Streptomyces TaxID=2593676 RepID=UPI002156664D|nr:MULTISPECIES: hypothetical protein [unclassified Streptomyces]